MVDSLGSNGPSDGELTLNRPPLHVQQTEDIVMEPVSPGGVVKEHQPHEVSTAPTPAKRPSLEGPLVESVLAMRISENIQPESSRTEAMEVDPRSDAFELSGNFASRGGQGDVADSPGELYLSQQVIGKDRQPELLGDRPFSLGIYKSPDALPSQAEMYAEYANAMLRIDGRAQENPTSAFTPNSQISPTAGPSKSTTQTLTRNQEAFGSSRRVLDRPVSLLPQPQAPVRRVLANEPVSTPLQSWPYHSKEQMGTQIVRRGNIKSRLMASVADWKTLRKPTREEFAFRSPVLEDAPVPPATVEERPQQMRDIESEVQASVPGPGDVDGEPLVMAEEAVSAPLVPQPPPSTEDVATFTLPPAEPSEPIRNSSSSKKSQLKSTGSTRKDKSRVKNEPPHVKPAIPQDLPEFPHLGPPPNADSPISPEEIGLSFERRKLDSDSMTQWDIIAAKLDGTA
ncbi:hypothetical protein FS837_003871 [Tulasnella sp. UAMH 9824]|nr:hypothetical protein FS837_003871 [Tulasnella sp. UAMH 9824]